ncbi:cell death abnormality protein 1-like [Crassostrea angulata]|uniref:cell death abnormality protein 1-like n=1 Tax=Magallana angulata TaxID=2784310 RepID=UPI0022B0B444|nr:cell death abnormality protein 1-like [Crassostrea angulata]
MEYKNLFFYLAGLSLALSYDDLSFNTHATQSHTYSDWNLFYASSAVDRNTSTCMRPREIGRNSQEKTVWWKVDLGGVYNIYSINILFKNYDGFEDRQRGRVAGFSLYVSTTGNIHGSFLCYKDGPQLPPLNFTTTCTEHGRYVIFYNERFDGVSYPEGYAIINVFNELCEVVIQGCKKLNVYGSNCDISCPINCKDNTCNILNGNCFGCKSGWRGLSCNSKCSQGLYGDNCSQLCVGHCRDGITCDHVNGQCEGGCDTGWTGSMCKRQCDDDNYGYNCVNNCSGHCLNGSLCNKQTGHCDKGCDPGYTNRKCNRECVKSYGKNCQYPCSQHCINQTCDRFTGKCLSWCQEGFYGEMCNQESQQREDVTPWIVAFAIVLFIVVLIITGGLVCFWILYKKLFDGNIRLCWKFLYKPNKIITTPTSDNKEANPNSNSNYQELNPHTCTNYAELKPSNIYQELKLPYVDENQYQNTTL